jgi:hypothetical protein
VQPITDEVITYQQKVADTFYELKLLPKQIKVSEVAKATVATSGKSDRLSTK